METDVLIDELTDCLEETATGKKVDTEWRLKEKPVTLKDNKGWKFKWNVLSKKFKTYELFVKGDTTVQGRLALLDGEDHIEIQNIETAPHNYGHIGKYKGVGGHLFAIACKLSFDSGYDGYVAFESKTDLIEYYRDRIGAKLLSGQRMYIDTNTDAQLVRQYLEEN